MNGIPRGPANPEVRSVWHSEGRTTDISTPLPRSSIATASEKPATPNFVATYVAQCDPATLLTTEDVDDVTRAPQLHPPHRLAHAVNDRV